MLKQELQHKLIQKLSPQQIQFIQLLQLSTTELEKRVEEELTQNPALDSEKNGKDDDDNNEQDIRESDRETEKERDKDEDFSSKESEEDEVETFDEPVDTDIDISDYLSDDGDDDYSYASPRDPNEENREIPVAGHTTLYESLYEQLSALKQNERERTIAEHLIGMLDEDGYLRRPLKNVAYDLTFLSNIHADEAELEKILRDIQSFDPPGIAARNLQECLLIQLDAKEDQEDEDIQLAKKIINDHLDSLGKKHYQKILKSLKIDREKLRDVIDVITHLNPKPGEGQLSVRGQYIIPDFTVTGDNGELNISLNSRNAPELRVSKDYQQTLMGYQKSKDKEKDKKLKDQVQFIKQRLDNAKWFIEAIRQRQNTLMMTMKTIVGLQRDFFIAGDFMKLNPMILKDVADRIGMDISTVSRVVNSKYVQTDHGIYALKEFFSEGITTDEGTEVSNKEVKYVLLGMIEKENKNKPLTDERLTEMLNEKGYNIARRTVAKYREQLNIPVARLRKEL